MTQEPNPLNGKPKLAYSLEEAAAATGYSVSTLRIAIRRNDLLARYANSKAIILADEMQNWLNSLATEPKGGHQPLSDLVDEADLAPFPGPPRKPEPAAAPAMTAQRLAYTFEQAAEQSGYSIRTLKQQVADGNLKARYANSKGVIRHADLDAWLDALPAEPPVK